jgi:hypothetical protein
MGTKMNDIIFSDSSGETLNALNGNSVTRWKAAAVHFLISFAVAMAVLVGILTVWYPQPYFSAMGGKNLLLLLGLVDVVSGPLITLIIFNPKKKGLKFDLAVIALVQLAALAFGLQSLFQARPVYVVLVANEFKVVSANEIDDEQLQKVTRAEFKSLGITGPQLVVADPPIDAKERDIAETGKLHGFGLQNMPRHYVPYGGRLRDVMAKSKLLSNLETQNAASFWEVKAFLNSIGKKVDDVRYIPLNAKKENMTVIVDARTGSLIEILRISPWR